MEVFENSIIATLRTNLRNQKQYSQEKSSLSSINSFKWSFKKTVLPQKKHFYSGDKVLFKAYKNMSFWEVGTIKQRIGELVYIVQEPKNTHKPHMNQLRKCHLNESEESP